MDRAHLHLQSLGLTPGELPEASFVTTLMLPYGETEA